MRRNEPPLLAIWMLEHAIPGQQDEALSGDLVEGFRAGRSDGWFWRQTLAAWLVGWVNYLNQRRSLLTFAVVWSSLSPAWTAAIDRIQSGSRYYGEMWEMHWPSSGLFTFFLWVALNVTFLWAGMLLFAAGYSRFAAAFSRARLKRALALVPLIFLPAYFATFVVMNLFAYPGLDVDRAALTPLGEVSDWRLWADALRIPYLLTFLWTLWGAMPTLRSAPAALIEWRWKPVKPQTEPGRSAVAPPPGPRLDPYTVKRFLAFMVGAGLLNTLIAGFLLCRLPAAHSPTLTSLIVRAAIYVAIGALAGAAGAWLYWQSPSSPFRGNPALPFPLFALVCAAGWVWAPAMVLFSEQISAATALIAGVGAFSLAAGLRHATASILAPAPQSPAKEDFEIFAESLYRPHREAHGYVIAIGLYAAVWAIATQSYYTASCLLGLSAFVFAWKRTAARPHAFESAREYRRAIFRLARVAIPAILVTIWALLDGIAHRNRAAQISAALAASNDASQAANSQSARGGMGGYESVILWPFPEKKQIVPPVLAQDNTLAPGSTRPLTIRFDGPYWFIQPPDERPGPSAHQAHGTPLGVNIESNNTFPIFMEAHQTLGAPVRIARCREIDVEIENRDNKAGAIELAVLLRDEAAPGKPTAYLGQQTIPSTYPANFSFKGQPVFETLRFAVPADAKIRKFNEISVTLLPGHEHALAGPKIAIQQFQLFPR